MDKETEARKEDLIALARERAHHVRDGESFVIGMEWTLKQISAAQPKADERGSAEPRLLSDLRSLSTAIWDACTTIRRSAAIAEVERLIDLAQHNASTAALEAQERNAADLLALQCFVDSVIGEFPDIGDIGDIDGFALQDIAESCGLLVKQTTMVPCGDQCSCAEIVAEGKQTDCMRVQPVLQRARRAAAISAGGRK